MKTNRQLYSLAGLFTLIFNINLTYALPINTFIYKGNIATKEMYPFVVSIYNKDFPEHADCTGTVLNKNWILTASHCVLDTEDGHVLNPADFSVGTGVDAGDKSKAEKIIAVTEFHPFNQDHSFFDKKHDIALLKLAHPINAPSIDLVTPNQYPQIKDSALPVVEVGFGDIDLKFSCDQTIDKDCDKDDFENVFDATLRYGNQITITDTEAVRLLEQYDPEDYLPKPHNDVPVYVPESMIATISSEGTPGLPGDSGGPLIIKDPNTGHYYQLGVTSFGTGPTKANYATMAGHPTIYANLAATVMNEFIRKTISAN